MVYRVAVIGGGAIAEEHLLALEGMERAKAVAVADLIEERAEGLAGRYGGLSAYTDYKEMIVREKPDIAIITLPHFLHMTAALFCIESGVHVLLEKPMALDVGQCDEIIEAASRQSVRLMVGHTQHYIAENRTAKRIIDEGGLGKLVMINDVRNVYYFQDRRPAWFFQKALAGGGILMNLGSHSVDKIAWLAGSAVHSVKAVTSHYGGKGDIEGSGMAFLHLENGVPATVSQSGYQGLARNETELVFTEGMLKLETGKALWLSSGGEYERVETDRQEPPFVLQLLDLIARIEAGDDSGSNSDAEASSDSVEWPGPSLEHSRHAVAVVRAMYASHKSGREEAVTDVG